MAFRKISAASISVLMAASLVIPSALARNPARYDNALPIVIPGSCSPETSSRFVNRNGNVVLEVDTDTTGTAGFEVLLKIKAHKNTPSQAPTPIKLTFIAAALLFLPAIINETSITIFDCGECEKGTTTTTTVTPSGSTITITPCTVPPCESTTDESNSLDTITIPPQPTGNGIIKVTLNTTSGSGRFFLSNFRINNQPIPLDTIHTNVSPAYPSFNFCSP